MSTEALSSELARHFHNHFLLIAQSPDDLQVIQNSRIAILDTMRDPALLKILPVDWPHALIAFRKAFVTIRNQLAPPNKESAADLRETLKQVTGQVLEDWSQTFPPSLTDPADPAHIQGRLDGLALVLAKLIHDRDSQIPAGETSILSLLRPRSQILRARLAAVSSVGDDRTAQAGVKHSLDQLIAFAESIPQTE